MAKRKPPPPPVDTLGNPVPGARQCRKCTAWIVFVVNPETGKPVPLDISSQAYRIVPGAQGPELEKLPGAYVSHYRTCPGARDFSKGGR